MKNIQISTYTFSTYFVIKDLIYEEHMKKILLSLSRDVFNTCLKQQWYKV